jgi:general secretion pathway protein D
MKKIWVLALLSFVAVAQDDGMEDPILPPTGEPPVDLEMPPPPEDFGDIPPLEPPTIDDSARDGIRREDSPVDELPPMDPLEDFDDAPSAPSDMGGGSSRGSRPAQPSPVADSSPKPDENNSASDLVPDGQELVNINFPELTDIKDIIHAVSLWTGKNVILGRDVTGKVQMISPRKVTKVEAYQAFLSALNLLGLTTVETGKVIKIVSVRTALKSNLKTFLGSTYTPLTDELITQIVPLKYVNATEIQKSLSKILTANSVIAYEPTNTLIISDSGFKVKRFLDIIQLMDVQTQQPKVAIVPIRFGDAKGIAAMVSEIFKARSTGPGKATASASYLSYKIMTDERTNSVVIFGPPRTIADVKELVKEFDLPIDDPSRQATIHVRPLDYADAAKLASTLKSLTTGGQASGPSSARRFTPPPIGPGPKPVGNTNNPPDVAVMDNDVKITADESSNSLLITGSRAAYESINSLIRKLDIRRSQVFVEAEILDVNIKGGFRFGTSVFAGTGKEGAGAKMAYTWEAANMAPLIVSQAAGTNDPASKAQAAGVFGSDLNIGILSGQPVTVPGLGSITPGALIKLIKTDSNARILSSPHILTLNNEEAMISVGDKLFYEGGSQMAQSGIVTSDVKSEKVDLTLNIKPNVSNSNYVTLKIDLDANSGEIDAQSRLPNVLQRKSSQIVTVKNGQTVVISGLVQTSEFEVYQKIPLLGDIPILGWLFRNSSIQKRTSNLMIFLTPHIVHGANDLAEIYKTKIQERDELFSKVYGESFKRSDFYDSLPRLKDGTFVADSYDVIDLKQREKRKQEFLRDMGYTEDEIQTIAPEGASRDSGSSEPIAIEVEPATPMFEENSDQGDMQPVGESILE